MLSFLRQGTLPILSLILMMLGNSLLMALIPIKLSLLGASEFIVASIFSSFALGFVIGACYMDRLIARVGHIRSYTGFASILCSSILFLAFVDSLHFWMFLRLIHGICTAGLCLIIQSWLLSFGTKATRGTILSLYMVFFYGAEALGAQLITFSSVNSPLHFCLAGLLCSFSILPLNLTHLENPSIPAPQPQNFYKLYQLSASSMLGCFGAGIIIGSIYGLLPYYASLEGFSPLQITRILSITILGGMCLQYPIGLLSDLWDRRRMMVIVSLGTTGVSLLLLAFGSHHGSLFVLIYGLLGGLSFTIYPLCINHARDSMDTTNLLSSMQGLLLAYSFGRVAGPQIASVFMTTFGPKGLLVCLALISCILAFFFKWRRRQANEQEEETEEIPQREPL
jgi:MFS family permease